MVSLLLKSLRRSIESMRKKKKLIVGCIILCTYILELLQLFSCMLQSSKPQEKVNEITYYLKKENSIMYNEHNADQYCELSDCYCTYNFLFCFVQPSNSRIIFKKRFRTKSANNRRKKITINEHNWKKSFWTIQCLPWLEMIVIYELGVLNLNFEIYFIVWWCIVLLSTQTNATTVEPREAYFNGSAYLRLRTPMTLWGHSAISFRTCRGELLFLLH